MSKTQPRRVPPRWILRIIWRVHRGLLKRLGERVLASPRPGKAGMLLLRSTGRRSGELRSVIVSYVAHGDSCVTLAMNAWADAMPAWWRNLQANPDAWVRTVDGCRAVRAREALGDERARILAELAETSGWGDIAYFAGRLSRQLPVVVLEPRAGADAERPR